MQPVDPQTSDRAARAAKIIAQPASFKICEACSSIIARAAAICSNCNGYRFDDDPLAVIAQTRLLATRPQTSVTGADLE